MWKEDYAIQCIRDMDCDFMVIDTEGRVILARRKIDGKIILDDIVFGGYETIKDVFYVPEFPDVLVQVVKPNWEGNPCLHDDKGRVYDIHGFMSWKPKKKKKSKKKKNK